MSHREDAFVLVMLCALWIVVLVVAVQLFRHANNTRDAELWRCVSLIAEQPPKTDVAEALERCRVALAKKEMRP